MAQVDKESASLLQQNLFAKISITKNRKRNEVGLSPTTKADR
jgi:hypothetical protein